ncbi:MAG: hypothetical protein LC128_06020 [Chitinophagales bacterium]|jgi:hypothetical protein|nr:hypothetical protein [Chitinophagales bacterium]
MAVVDYLDKKRKPPPELVMGWGMRRFGGLLEAGGMLDQPVGLMYKIRSALNVEDIWKTYKRIKPGDMGKWIKNNPDDWKFVKAIEELMNGR